MNWNKVTLAGNLTRDPELKYSTKGVPICKIGLAINRQWKSESGEKKEEVTFIDCTAFGRTAEAIGQYMVKGRPIFIEGRLNLETWDDKQSGQKRSKLGVIIEQFQFIGGNKGEGKSSAPKTDKPASESTDAPPPNNSDDVPF